MVRQAVERFAGDEGTNRGTMLHVWVAFSDLQTGVLDSHQSLDGSLVRFAEL